MIPFLTVVLTVLGATPATAAAAATTPPWRRAELSFDLLGNVILVPATLNGAPLRLIFDTGAAASAVSREAAARAGLGVAEQISGAGAGGTAAMGLARFASLAVGSIEVHDLTGAVMDFAEIRARLGDEVDGVLGYDVFGSGRVEIDYPARRLTLTLPPARPPEALSVTPDRIESAAWGFALGHPGSDWTVSDNGSPPSVKAHLRHLGGAEIEVVVMEVAGLGLDALQASLEASLPLQVVDYRRRSVDRSTRGERDWIRVLYEGREADGERRYETIATAVDDRLITVTASQPVSSAADTAAAVARVLASFEVTARRRD